MKPERMTRLAAILSQNYVAAVTTLRRERKRLRRERQRWKDTVAAQGVIQSVAASVQERAHSRISHIVTRCLEAVFREPYEFRIHFEKKRGRTEARLVFVRKKLELTPTSSCAGGAIDVASLALRLACLSFQKPQVRKVVIADEPFRFVDDRGNRDRVRSLLETLSEEMGFQFVFTTHDKGLETGKIVELT